MDDDSDVQPHIRPPNAKHNHDKVDQIAAAYANSFAIEPTVWDVKARFGAYSDQSKSIDWHSETTMPWATAILLAHYLQLNIALYELENGKIRVPMSAIPALPKAPDDDADEAAKAKFALQEEYRNRLIASLKDTAPPK
jgi:hypothetical protein